ncbi:cobalt ABC transporter, inner membrane subunit CbiQ [Solidesulfovibrio carbinoliphilus subsp. oakridgensis]|uniref:Cobalt ABC transporter, inner membrane subunit CbiQ n=1 Tax=Solidesulfovibrio carbinoliphilus subsp. oakridgensis TaxID=694327 RepID=G7QDY3_9BACT|nr:cobalt ECF transporter T component CbiQ [Solidesulfovibrio carbinoliphilus]EHJ46639.1 cobalt ABC transporter, inner membrane subunit CbiQ [Solidesulfovibrio carbinoliphilus subsp. oakridgensis]
MIDEPLTQGASRIHALDPRHRLVACLGLSLAAVLAVTPAAPLVVLAVGLVLTAAARPPAVVVWKRFCAVNFFVAFLWVILPLTTPGAPAWTLPGPGGLALTREGVHLATLITLKTNAVFFCLVPLLATIPVPALGRAMTALGVPAKFSFLFLFTYRYLHVIAEEYARLATAARLRGFVPATDGRTYRTYAALVAMVLVRSYDRSQRVYQSMLLRGFAGVFPSLDRFKSGRGDAIFLALALAVAAGAGSLDFFLSGRGHG